MLCRQNDTPDPDVFDRVSRRFEAAAPMVKKPAFREAAERLSCALSRAARSIRSAGTTPREIDDAFERLIAQLELMRDGPETVAREPVGRTLGWLNERDLALPLVVAVRQHLCRPTLYITATLESLAAGIDRSISDRADVCETILGTRYVGCSDIDSHVHLTLRTDSEQMAMVFHLDTIARARTTGYRGSAKVSSHSTTEVQGWKEILIAADGFRPLPAESLGTTSSRITGFSWSRLFGHAVARQQACRSKPATDCEVVARAQRRVRLELDRQVGDMVDSLQRDYLYQVRMPLVIHGLLPNSVRCESRTDSLQVAATQASYRQLAASSDPPGRGLSDVAIQVHASLVNNTAETVLGGKTFGEEQWREPFVELFGKSPEALRLAHPDRPWSISFEEQQPLELQLDGRSIAIRIRARRLEVGDQAYPAVEISAKYQLVVDEPGFVCQRDGPLEVVLPQSRSESNLGLRQQVLRSMVRKRFDPIFAAEFRLDRLPLPPPWRGGGAIRIVSVEATGKWLHFNCVHDDLPVRTAAE